jgi:long-chain acyl-CoA synthetase
MKGYYNNPDATAETFTEDGWLKTGDIGHLDNESYLYLTGRAKSLIVTEGGKNVFPEEIENCFQLYDEVEQVLVRGYLKDEALKSEGVEALIYPAEGIAQDSDSEVIHNRMKQIVDQVNKELPMYKRIDRFSVLAEPLEMTTTRKIKRYTVAHATNRRDGCE